MEGNGLEVNMLSPARSPKLVTRGKSAMCPRASADIVPPNAVRLSWESVRDIFADAIADRLPVFIPPRVEEDEEGVRRR